MRRGDPGGDRAACRVRPHDNAGPLSVEHGFLQARHRRERDTRLASAMGRAWPWNCRRCTPGVGAARPDRDAAVPLSAATLYADDAPTRAATVLGILVSAHHRVEPRRAATTPPPTPAAVARGLSPAGRAAPHLSYADLVVMNWRHAADAATGPVRVENTRLPDPRPWGCPRRSSTWPSSRCSPGAPRWWPPRSAPRRDRRGRRALRSRTAWRRWRRHVHDPSPHGLPKISPRPGSRFHARSGRLGQDGRTASRCPHLRRPRTEWRRLTHVPPSRRGHRAHRLRVPAGGEETLRLRRAFPPHWREFVAAVLPRVGVRAYTSRRAASFRR